MPLKSGLSGQDLNHYEDFSFQFIMNVDGTNFIKLNNRITNTYSQLNLYWLKDLTPLLL